MSVLQFHLRYPDGRVENLNIEAERAVVGSGAHCEIRLPLEAARVEHVAITLSSSGPFAEALSFDPPPTVNGVQFTQGPLLPDSALVLGGIEITCQVAGLTQQSQVIKKADQKASPLTMILLLIMLPLAAFVLLYDDDSSGVAAPPNKVPELFDPPITACKAGGAEALTMALDRFSLAETKRERSPFDVRDGITAVPLYELASVCFKSSGHGNASDDASNNAKQLRTRLSEEYKTHVTWLEHCIKIQDWRSAQREIALLLAFTEGKKGEYVSWLSNLDRQLRVKYGQRSP